MNALLKTTAAAAALGLSGAAVPAHAGEPLDLTPQFQAAVSYANGRIVRWIEAQSPHPSAPPQKTAATPQAFPVVVVPAVSAASLVAFVARLPLPLLACGVGF